MMCALKHDFLSAGSLATYELVEVSKATYRLMGLRSLSLLFPSIQLKAKMKVVNHCLGLFGAQHPVNATIGTLHVPKNLRHASLLEKTTLWGVQLVHKCSKINRNSTLLQIPRCQVIAEPLTTKFLDILYSRPEEVFTGN